MSSISFWVLIATVVALIGVGTFIAVTKARAKSRAKSRDRGRAKALAEARGHQIDSACAEHGHSYREIDNAWRCTECGNYVPRVEGEVYGPAEMGLRERRREDR